MVQLGNIERCTRFAEKIEIVSFEQGMSRIFLSSLILVKLGQQRYLGGGKQERREGFRNARGRFPFSNFSCFFCLRFFLFFFGEKGPPCFFRFFHTDPFRESLQSFEQSHR